MSIRQLLSDDDAVSPVIGVILMVAITVILAAVIGAFVLGFGGGGPSAPTANWDSSQVNDSHVEFELSQTSDSLDNSTLSFNDISGSAAVPTEVGDSVIVEASDQNGSVTIVWEDDGSSSTLATHEMS